MPTHHDYSSRTRVSSLIQVFTASRQSINSICTRTLRVTVPTPPSWTVCPFLIDRKKQSVASCESDAHFNASLDFFPSSCEFLQAFLLCRPGQSNFWMFFRLGQTQVGCPEDEFQMKRSITLRKSSITADFKGESLEIRPPSAQMR